jgi:ABC-type antimicrobial peptide transport system permease subunit
MQAEHDLTLEAASPPTVRHVRGEPSLLDAPGLDWHDLANEALAGLSARPVRMILTVLGTVIGLTALVSTLGLSRTAANRIVGRFDELAATQVEITMKESAETRNPSLLPWDAGARMARLNGVDSAGTLTSIDIGKDLIGATPLTDPTRRTRFNLSVHAASPSLFTAVRAHLVAGRFPDEGHSERADRLAVLGIDAARKLGIHTLEDMPAIAIGDQIYAVAGIVDAVARQHTLLTSVIIPEGTARREFHVRAPELVVVETRVGAAQLIGRQSLLALIPNDPSRLKVAIPEEPQRAREGVSSDLNALFLLLGSVSLLVGAIGIANITLISVMERTGEIGLRRALGATNRDIAAQFLMESAVIGFIGGIVGASIGTLVVVGVSATRQWTPILDAPVPLLAPIFGALVGVLAGLYPAARAAKLEPVEALRSGT